MNLGYLDQIVKMIISIVLSLIRSITEKSIRIDIYDQLIPELQHEVVKYLPLSSLSILGRVSKSYQINKARKDMFLEKLKSFDFTKNIIFYILQEILDHHFPIRKLTDEEIKYILTFQKPSIHFFIKHPELLLQANMFTFIYQSIAGSWQSPCFLNNYNSEELCDLLADLPLFIAQNRSSFTSNNIIVISYIENYLDIKHLILDENVINALFSEILKIIEVIFSRSCKINCLPFKPKDLQVASEILVSSVKDPTQIMLFEMMCKFYSHKPKREVYLAISKNLTAEQRQKFKSNVDHFTTITYE